MIVGLGMSASVTICIVLLVNIQNRANTVWRYSRLRASGPIPFHPGITAREPDLRLEKQELDTRKMGKDNQ
jgi:hypothetical protein